MTEATTPKLTAESLGFDAPPPDQKPLLQREPKEATAKTVALSLLVESKTNPRRAFGDIAALAKSIESVGLLEPLVVRPLDGAEYEVVAGARRLRAAKKAGLEVVPVSVRDLTDDEVLEIQVVENVQRDQLSPLEEAHGYEAMTKAGYTADTIAARVGKSKGWVYSRLKLLALGPEGRSAMLAGTLPPSVAVPLARRPHANQAALLQRLSENLREGEVIDARWAIEQIQREERSLKTTPFDPKAELAGAPPCAKCPKNSANAPADLFADYGPEKSRPTHGVCSDPECFEKKAAEAFEGVAKALVQKGAVLLTPEQTREVAPHGFVAYGGQWLDGAAVCYDDSKQRIWDQLVKSLPDEKRPTLHLCRGDEGKMLRLYKRDETLKALAGAGVAFAKRKQAPSPAERKSERAKTKAAEAKGRVRADITDQALAAIVENIAKEGLKDADLRAVVALQFHEVGDTEARYAAALDLPKSVETAKGSKLGAILFAVTFDHLIAESAYGATYPKELREACARHGVDLAKLEKAAELAKKAEAAKKKAKDNPKKKEA